MQSQTNAAFAAVDPVFRKACEMAGVPPTRRQASKWHLGKGRAFERRKEAMVKLQETAK